MHTKGRSKNRIKNLLLPAVVFGFLSGTFTSVLVTLYKACASKIIHFTESAYELMRRSPIYILAAVAVIFFAAYLYNTALTKHPNIKGGGIPTSIALLRGIISFRWVINIVYVFLMSLLSFFVGVPLGNEGPSVQMGTAMGKGIINIFSPKQKAYSRYAMTGGACAGFAVATGAPISGMLFAVEEAHGRISPMIIMVSAISVIFANITNRLLSPLLGVSTGLFEFENPLKLLSVKELWIPLLVGAVMGIFAVLFLKSYKLISGFFGKKLVKVPFYLQVCVILLAVLCFGLISTDFISTGHELTLHLFDGYKPIYILLVILLVRTLLTLSANVCGITGGIFLPIIALGAVVSAAVGNACVSFFNVNEQVYTVILSLGICGCIAGMMRMPLTAVFFAVEALGLGENIISVLIVAAAAYSVTEIFGAEGINDRVIELKIDKLYKDKQPVLKDCNVTVADGAFAVGKQVRDILWPHNLFVLSVQHERQRNSIVDQQGDTHIHPGDILHVRYSSPEPEKTAEELEAIVGEQK